MVAYHFVGYFGHYGYDDIWYGRLGKRMADGLFTLNSDHYTYRWGLIVPLALSYKLFGVNDHASALPALFITIGILLLLWRLTRYQKLPVVLLTLSMFLLYSWSIFYSDKLMPDVLVAFGFTASLWALFEYRFSNPSTAGLKQAGTWAFLLALSLFFAFVSKATIFLCTPVFLYFFISDILQKRHYAFWTMVAGSVLLLGGAYLLFINLQTGSPWYRFEAIRLNSYFNECSYDQLPLSATLRRIGYQYFLIFTRFGLMITLALGILGSWGYTPRSLWKLDSRDAFLQAAFLMTLLSANFMTISYEAYVPICPDPRQCLFLTPISAVAAAPVAYRFLKDRKWRWAVFMLVLFFAVLSFFIRYENRYFTYVPMLLLCFTRLILPVQIAPKWFMGLVVAFMVILWLHPIESMMYAQKTGYVEQRQLIYDRFQDGQKKRLVVANTVQRNFGQYLMAFDSTATQFVAYDELDRYDPAAYDEVYVLTNAYARILCGLEWEDWPPYIKKLPDSMKRVYQEKGVDLFRVEDVRVLKE